MMPPLIDVNDRNIFMRWCNEFDRACADGEGVHACAAAATLLGIIDKACDPARMMPVHEQSVRYCEMALRDRAQRLTPSLKLGDDDEL